MFSYPRERLALLCAGLLLACQGAYDASDYAEQSCQATEQVPLDEPTVPGPSGRDLLDQVGTDIVVTAHGVPQPPAGDLYDDPTSEYQLTIVIEPTREFATATAAECYAGEQSVYPFVAVEVRARVTSDDGTIDASTPAVLRLGGDSAPSSMEPLDVEDLRVPLALTADETGVGPSIDARTFRGWLPHSDGNGYLSFPTACGEDQQPGLDEARGRISGAQVLDELDAALSSLTFVGEALAMGYHTDVPAGLSFTPIRETACGSLSAFRILTEVELTIPGQTQSLRGPDVVLFVSALSPSQFLASTYAVVRGGGDAVGDLMGPEVRSTLEEAYFELQLDVEISDGTLESSSIRALGEFSYRGRDEGDAMAWLLEPG